MPTISASDFSSSRTCRGTGVVWQRYQLGSVNNSQLFISLPFAVALCYLLASRHAEAAGFAASHSSVVHVSGCLRCDLWTAIPADTDDIRQLGNVQHRVTMRALLNLFIEVLSSSVLKEMDCSLFMLA